MGQIVLRIALVQMQSTSAELSKTLSIHFKGCCFKPHAAGFPQASAAASCLVNCLSDVPSIKKTHVMLCLIRRLNSVMLLSYKSLFPMCPALVFARKTFFLIFRLPLQICAKLLAHMTSSLASASESEMVFKKYEILVAMSHPKLKFKTKLTIKSTARKRTIF